MAKIVTKGNVVSGLIAIAMLAALKRFLPQVAAKVGV